MSSEKRVYLGGYIELPAKALKKQWDDIAMDLKIDFNEFVKISDDSPILMSNYTNYYKSYNEEIQILTLNPMIIKYLTLEFNDRHGEDLTKLSKCFKTKFEVKVAFISYWW